MRPTRAKAFGPWLAVAATLVVCAAPALADEPSAGRYGDIGQALALLVVFGIVLWVLGKFAWKPIIAQLQRREQEIAERLRDSERRQQEAKDLEIHFRTRMDRAESEAQEVLTRSAAQASEAREALLAEARGEAGKAIETAKVEIERFKQGALHDLQEAMASLTVDVAGEILREELDEAKHAELADRSLRRIRDRAARDTS